LRHKGRFSFIIPNTILVNENATKIRELILKNYSLETIRVFKQKVFENAQVETVIVIIENTVIEKNNIIKIENEVNILIPTEKFLNNKNFKFNVFSDGLYGLITIHHGHHNIHEYNIEFLSRKNNIQRFLPIFGLGNIESFFFQNFR